MHACVCACVNISINTTFQLSCPSHKIFRPLTDTFCNQTLSTFPCNSKVIIIVLEDDSTAEEEEEEEDL